MAKTRSDDPQAFRERVRRRKRRKARKGDASELRGLSPNPATNLQVADIALRGVTMLARRGVQRALLGKAYAPGKARAILKGRTFTDTIVNRTIAKVAIGSVPGALAVGGGILAKALYDRSRGEDARVKGEAALQDQAEDGADTGEQGAIRAEGARDI